MASVRTKLRLTGEIRDGVEAILEALPSDAVIRGEEDGVGRYAGERVLVVKTRDGDRLLMFRGSYGSLKSRLDEPHLDVLFRVGNNGLSARLRREQERKKSIGTHIMDVLGSIATVAVIVIVYHMVMSEPLDRTLTAIISVIGGLAWSGFTIFRPKRKDTYLEDLVKEALKPLERKEDDADEDADEDEDEDEEDEDEDEDEEDEDEDEGEEDAEKQQADEAKGEAPQENEAAAADGDDDAEKAGDSDKSDKDAKS
jgi:hypothetical protein